MECSLMACSLTECSFMEDPLSFGCLSMRNLNKRWALSGRRYKPIQASLFCPTLLLYPSALRFCPTLLFYTILLYSPRETVRSLRAIQSGQFAGLFQPVIAFAERLYNPNRLYSRMIHSVSAHERI